MQDMTGGMKIRQKGKAVVKYQPAPVPAPSSVVFHLNRIANVCGRAADKVPEPVRQITYGSARIFAQGFAGFVLIAILAIGALYASLTRGPISMSFLVPPIEKAVNASLSGFRFDIGDAVLRKADDGYGIEFRLADVRLVGDDGDRIVEAPLASADVSLPALLRGRFAPGQVDLIGPRLFLHYSEEKGLTISSGNPRAAKADPVGQPVSGAEAAQRTPADPLADGSIPADAPSATAPALDLTTALKNVFVAMRRGETAYLTNFGIRDAVVFFDRGEHVTRWDVPQATIDLDHERRNSAVLGNVTVRSGAGEWQVKLRAGQNRRNGVLDLAVSVDDVNPRLIAEEFPSYKTLKIWDMPVSVSADLDLDGNGDVLSAEIEADLSHGHLFAPWDENHPATIDHAALRATYSRADGKIELQPSEIRWGTSRIKFGGIAQRREGSGRWDYRVLTDEIALGAEEFGLPAISLDRIISQGSYDPKSQAVDIDRFFLEAADAQINLRGTIRHGEQSPAIQMTGSISAMPIAFFKLIWPKFVAFGARDWIGNHVPTGKIAGGTVKIDIPADVLAAVPDGAEIPQSALDFRMDLENMQVRYWAELPPFFAPKATAQVSGHRFFFVVPDSTVSLPSGNKVQLTSGEFIVGDLRLRVPDAEIHFKTQSDAKAAMEWLDHEPLHYIRALKMKVPNIDAPLATTFSLAFPLLKDVKFSDVKMNGRAHLQDVRASELPGGFGIHSGTIDFDISETAIEGRGDVKMNGMPVKIAWQRIYDAPAEKQPPLRLKAIIDEAARDQMGLEVNHVVRGPVAAELTLSPRKDAPSLVSFEANLTDTDIIMASMGWRKPPGQRAVFAGDIENADRGILILRNLNLTGDDLAARGEVTLNDKRQPIAFNFPTVSLNLQTQMELKGELAPGNIWKVRASGAGYDGRQFFRSLFSAGQLTEDQPQLPNDTPGVDIKADIDNVLGFFDTTVKKVSIEARRRNNKLVYLDLHGRLNGKDPVAARLDAKPGEARTLLAEATDAGAAFRIVGFYPSARGGEVSLKVNLDGSGPADKTGVLYVHNFVVVGDQVVGEVLSGPKQGERPVKARQPQAEYNQLQFDNMRVPFSVGAGQFVLHDGIINGPMLGATMRGNIDFKRERMSLSGTYVPLFGLNGAIGAVPILGDLLVSRHGEGLFGITFAVQGQTSNPDVLVNPMSMVAPGFLRQLFEFDQSVPHIIPPDNRPPEKTTSNARASSLPPATR